MEKIWSEIPSYSGYKASNEGEIYSKRLRRNLSQLVDQCGYRTVGIRKDNEKFKQPVLVHRLISFAFIPNPQLKPFVNHKDGNKLNNKIDNLEWCTRKENILHAIKTGLQRPTDFKKKNRKRFGVQTLIDFYRKTRINSTEEFLEYLDRL